MKFEICLTEGSGDSVALVEAPAAPFYRDAEPPRSATAALRNTGAPLECDIPGISKAIRMIRNEYSRPLTVSSLARECGMSVRTLHRLYRSVTGNTIGKDLVARRIEVAADLLREVDVKLEPLAMETGLRSAKNLCRLFKEHLGVTPGQWKESYRRPDAGLASSDLRS
jgi:transcriptional regulator GlxA family with amidase domain